MKLILIAALLCLLPVAVLARDLVEAARTESRRRREVAGRSRIEVPIYTNADLERFRHGSQATGSPRGAGFHQAEQKRRPRRSAAVRDSQSLTKARAFWQKERRRHERDLSRLDAQIRRLEWRLAERIAKKKNGERLARDPTLELIEESLEALGEERRRLEQEFLERGRKAGALPGWLR